MLWIERRESQNIGYQQNAGTSRPEIGKRYDGKG